MSVQREFIFQPGDWVVIMFCDLKYRGRVASCKWEIGRNVYEVEYVDDRGDMKNGWFNADELI